MIKKAVARSIAEFVSIVAEIAASTGNQLWFRGHADAGWSLVPSGLRGMEIIFDSYGRPVAPGTKLTSSNAILAGPSIESMLANFKRRSRPFIQDKPENDFEWMFLAQHHRLPTRLLDWSTNALVALFFAADGAASNNADPDEAIEEYLNDEGSDGFTVYVIDPGAINDGVIDIAAPIDIAADWEAWSSYLDPAASGSALLPICVTAPQNSERIRAQSGAFTLHGALVKALEHYEPLQPMITEIFMPNSVSESVRADLARLGMTRGFIYADLDSVAHDVVAEERIAYAANRARHAQEAAEFAKEEQRRSNERMNKKKKKKRS